MDKEKREWLENIARTVAASYVAARIGEYCEEEGLLMPGSIDSLAPNVAVDYFARDFVETIERLEIDMYDATRFIGAALTFGLTKSPDLEFVARECFRVKILER